MLPKILDLLQSRDELIKAAEAYHNPTHKILRIGFSPLVDMHRLDQALTPFRKAHPDVTVFFKECFIDDLSDRLNRQQIDIQVVPSAVAPEDESSYAFYQDNLYYLPAQNEHPSNKQITFNLTNLPDIPIILTGGGCGLNDALTKLLDAYDITLSSYPGQALTYKVIEDWASLGIGAGILPKAKISQENTAIYPILIRKNKPARFDYVWVWRDSSTMPEHIKTFIEYIKTTVPALIQGQAT